MEGSRLGGEVAELSLHSAIVLYQLIVVKMSVQKLCLLLMCYQMVLTSYVSATNNRKDSLLVLTTCNQIRFTVQLLSSVRAAVPLMDCVVVDDHSTDGTVEVLRRKGFAVITKDSPKGLTHSWNIGYKLAQQERYKYVFFANNDIVFSPLAIRVMQDQLLNNSLVVPLTSAKGAGHNPLQVQYYLL